MTADIIKFPDSKIFRDVPSEALQETMKRGAQKDAEAVTALIFNQLVGTFHQVGLETNEDPQMEKDFLFVYDLIRAIIYRQFELDHHLHKWLEESVKFSPLSQMEGENTNVMLTNDTMNTEDLAAFLKELDELTKKMEAGESPYDDLPSDVEPPEPPKKEEPKEE